MENDPINYNDPNGLVNYLKAAVSLANAANAGRLYGNVAIKIATAGGLLETGIGSLGSIPLYLWGAWNWKSANTALQRATQLWNEAVNECPSKMSWKNLNGLLPYGQYYDDQNEPGLIDFWKNKINTWKRKPAELFDELGTAFF